MQIKKVLPLLNQHQLERLKQIGLQSDGDSAMLSWKIGTYLNLTGDQVDALEEITFGKHPDSEESLKAMADEVSRVLKAEQREKWVKLLGRPLSFKELSLLHQNPGAHAGAFRIEFTEKNGLEIEGESEENNQE